MNPAPFRERLAAWFDANARDLPWRRTRDPYAILVSEMMLQQTQVATVIDYYLRWMERFPTAAALANADVSEVLHAWQGLGYYSRARNLHAAAKLGLAGNAEALERLPGVGSYTAAAVATFAFDESAPVLDANIIRVLARLFDYSAPVDTAAGRAFLRARALELLPAKNAGRHNAALMELGALVCVPRKPRCALCPVRPFCAAREPGKLPLKKPRRAILRVEQNCAYARRGDEILLEQQTGRRWRGLWCLPALPNPAGAPLAELKYPITHHIVTLRVHRRAAPAEIQPGQLWVPKSRAGEFPMPSPHRKALARLLELTDS